MSGQGDLSGTKPPLGEVLQLAIDQELMQVHTAMPGTIVAYDPATQTATVRLGFKRVYGIDETVVPYPDLVKVPVVQLQAGGSWVRLPVAANDRVLVLFAERALDVWFANGGQADPLDSRKFSISDAIAIPGLNPAANAIQGKGAADSIEIQNGGTWIEVTAAGKVKITNGTADLLGVLNSILTHLQSLTTAGGPTAQTISSATVANLVIDQTKLQSLMP